MTGGRWLSVLFQYSDGSLYRALKCFVTSRDDLALHELPPNTHMLEVVVNVPLERESRSFFFRISPQLAIVEIQLVKDILDDVVHPEPWAVHEDALSTSQLGRVFLSRDCNRTRRLRPNICSVGIKQFLDALPKERRRNGAPQDVENGNTKLDRKFVTKSDFFRLAVALALREGRHFASLAHVLPFGQI